MPGSTDWPIRTVPITKLKLDPQNVRLRHAATDEDEILAHLFEHEDVLGLLRDIARDGYFDNEQPMVVAEGDKFIVLEGNRRISSLKALARPDRVPAFAQRIRAAAARADDPNFPKRIRVMIAPDRPSALQVVARLHTRNPKKSWIREQQAKFYYDRVLEGETLQDLRREFPAAENIRDFIVAGQMMERLRLAIGNEPELLDFIESNKFKFTNFEYLYDTTTFRSEVGIVIDEGIVSIPERSPEFMGRLFRQIARDMRDNLINTRTVRVSSEDFTNYVKGLVNGAEGSVAHQYPVDSEQQEAVGGNLQENHTPESTSSTDPGNEGRSGSGTTADPSSSAEGQGEHTPTKRRPTKQRHDRKLDIRGIEFKLTGVGIRKRWDELIDINVRSFPNATFDILRTFIECAIKEYFNESGNPVTHPNPKSPVQMKQCLDHLEVNLGSERVVKDGVIRLKSRQTSDPTAYFSSSAALNDSNHEPNAVFNYQQVNEMWAQVKPLVKLLVSGPPKFDPGA